MPLNFQRVAAAWAPYALMSVLLLMAGLVRQQEGHGPVKAMILELDTRKAEAMMMPLIDAPAGSVSIRQKLTGFAEKEGLAL